MKQLFLLCLLGALVGGFPGAICAWFFTAGTGISGTTGEAICFIVNMLLSAGGAFIGMFLAKAIRGQGRVQYADITLPVALGVLCGSIAYTWLYWAITYAEPPL